MNAELAWALTTHAVTAGAAWGACWLYMKDHGRSNSKPTEKTPTVIPYKVPPRTQAVREARYGDRNVNPRPIVNGNDLSLAVDEAMKRAGWQILYPRPDEDRDQA